MPFRATYSFLTLLLATGCYQSFNVDSHAPGPDAAMDAPFDVTIQRDVGSRPDAGPRDGGSGDAGPLCPPVRPALAPSR